MYKGDSARLVLIFLFFESRTETGINFTTLVNVCILDYLKKSPKIKVMTILDY